MVNATHRVVLVNEFVTKGLRQSKSQIDGANKATEGYGKSLENVNKQAKTSTSKHRDMLSQFTRFRWTLVNVTMAMGALYGAYRVLIKPFADLEKSMKNVQKTTNVTNKELGIMTQDFLELSTTLPITANELADIAVVAGQLGVRGVDNIKKFTETVGILASVTGLTSETAAQNLAKIANAFNTPISQVGDLANVLNELENTTAATVEELLSFTKKAAAVASTAGFSPAETMAIGTTLIAAGMQPSRAATRLKSALNKMTTDTAEFTAFMDKQGEEWMEVLRDKPIDALDMVLVKLKEMPDSVKQGRDAFELFGATGKQVIIPLIANYDKLQQSIIDANKEIEGGTSIYRELITQTDTLADKQTKLFNIYKREMFGPQSAFGAVYEGLIQSQRTVDLYGKLVGEQGLALNIAMGPQVLAETLKNMGDELSNFVDRGKLDWEEYNSIITQLKTQEAVDQFYNLEKILNSLKKANEDLIKSFGDKKLHEVMKDIFPTPTDAELEVFFPGYIAAKEANTLEFNKNLLEEYLALRKEIDSFDFASNTAEEAMAYGKLTEKLSELNAVMGEQGILAGAQLIHESFSKLNDEVEELTYNTDYYKNRVSALKGELSGLDRALSATRDQMSAVESSISNIIGRRFNIGGISETGISNIMSLQELELQKAQFATLGLGTAEEFLGNASVITTKNIEDQTEAVMKLIDASSTGEDQFEAWQTTLRETIKSLVLSSQDLDKDVTKVVKDMQSELLGFTQSDSTKSDQFEAMENNLSNLRTAQGIFFGEEQQQLEYSEKLREDRINGMNESAEQAIANLEIERTTLDMLLTQEQQYIDLQDIKRVAIDQVAESEKRLNEILKERVGLQTSGGFVWATPEDRAAYGSPGDTVQKPSTGGGSGGTAWERRSATDSGGGDIENPDQSYSPPGLNDFISRPGQPVASFSPNDTIIGVKDTGMIGGGTTIKGNVIVQVSERVGSATQLAIEIERKLTSIA